MGLPMSNVEEATQESKPANQYRQVHPSQGTGEKQKTGEVLSHSLGEGSFNNGRI